MNERKKLKKEIYNQDKDLAVFLNTEEANDKIDKVQESLNDIPDALKETAEIQKDILDKLDEESESLINIEGETEVVELRGEKGDKGDKGDMGECGEKGDRGEDGLNGKDGKDGQNGIDGIDGKDGVDGVDGKDGERGEKGEAGKDGNDGKDGKVEHILKEIKSPKSKYRLTIKDIEGLPLDIATRGGHGIGKDATVTFTNKRITPRTGTITSSANPTINTDNIDIFTITAQGADITSMTTNLSGTPTTGQKLIIRITGTAARAITWGTKFSESSDLALPLTTTTTKTLYCGFVWNEVSATWQLLALLDNF